MWVGMNGSMSDNSGVNVADVYIKIKKRKEIKQ